MCTKSKVTSSSLHINDPGFQNNRKMKYDKFPYTTNKFNVLTQIRSAVLNVGQMIHLPTHFLAFATISKASVQHSRYRKSTLGPITTRMWTIIPTLSFKLGMFFSFVWLDLQ